MESTDDSRFCTHRVCDGQPLLSDHKIRRTYLLGTLWVLEKYTRKYDILTVSKNNKRLCTMNKNHILYSKHAAGTSRRGSRLTCVRMCSFFIYLFCIFFFF